MSESCFRGMTLHSSMLAAVMATCCLGATAARAATIPVADGEVEVASNGLCSLREAIHNANADAQVDNTDCVAGSGPDVLELATDSAYVLPDEDEGSSGLPVLSSEIVINGNGSAIERDELAVPCNLDGTQIPGEFRIMTIDASGDVTLNDLSLQAGCADGSNAANDGGAIRVDDGSLTLDRVAVVNNFARDKSGGLDTTRATVTIVDSRFSSNQAQGGGGAIGNGNNSTMTIERSTISNNFAGGDGGGGIGNFGALTVVNSTISANTDSGTSGGGGGIGNVGSVELIASTVTGNASSGLLGGGGIGNAGSMTVKNSIVANSTAGGDCVSVGALAAEGDNFDTDGTCVAIDPDFTQVTSGQLALGPLTDNGGPTRTHALLAGSVALDAATDCTLLDGSTPVTEDQRGIARPQGGLCDVGAFELELEVVPVAPPAIAKAFAPNPIAVGGTSTLTFAITNPNAGDALTGVAFNDAFPAGLEVAAPPNATTTDCGAPTFAPVAGSNSVSFSDGTVAAAGTCTVTVDVTATTAGDKVNTTGNVTSTEGGTGNTGGDTLTVNGAATVLEIPTLSEWAALLLAALLAAAAIVRLRL